MNYKERLKQYIEEDVIYSNYQSDKFDMSDFDKFCIEHCKDIESLLNENQELKKQLDCALEILAKMFPPCERDGFMDKYSDYCQLNCGVDEEVFKKCWLMYIKDKLKEVE